MQKKQIILLLIGIILIIPYSIVGTQGQKWYEEGMTILVVFWLNLISIILMIVGIIMILISLYLILKRKE